MDSSDGHNCSYALQALLWVVMDSPRYTGLHAVSHPIIRAFPSLMIYLKGRLKCFKRCTRLHVAINSNLYGLNWEVVIKFDFYSHWLFSNNFLSFGKLLGDVWGGKIKARLLRCNCSLVPHTFTNTVTGTHIPRLCLSLSHTLLCKSLFLQVLAGSQLWLCNTRERNWLQGLILSRTPWQQRIPRVQQTHAESSLDNQSLY